MARASMLLGCAVLALASCGENSAAHGSYQLFRNLSLSRGLEVVTPADLDDAALRPLAERVQARSGREVALARIGKSAHPKWPRIVIADASTEGVDRLLAALEVERAPSGSFAFLDRSYDARDDALVATFADPERAGLPVTLYFGVDAASAASLARDLTPTWRPAFRCWRGGLIEREGTWNEDGDAVWSAAQTELDALVRTPVATLAAPGFELLLHAEFDDAAVVNYRERLRSVREQVCAWFGADAMDDARAHLRVHLWPNAEQLALVTGTWAWSTAGPVAGEVNVVLAPHSDDGLAAARAWALALAGPPAHAWMLDGLAEHLAKSWWGKHLYAEWLPYIQGRALEPSIERLVEASPRISPHLLVPLRGALFGWLFERDANALLASWRGASDVVLPNDAEFAAWNLRGSGGREAEWLAPRFDATRDTVFRRGVHLLPPRDDDARSFRGLGTSACERSLRAALEHGANAFAVSPIAYIDGGFPTWAGDIDDGPFATSTPDVALFETCARARGLRSLFAPQLLTARSSTWAGWTMAISGDDWSRFFAELERCTVHYALLAELCDADVLSLGTELGASTKVGVAPVDEAYTPDWLRHNGEHWRRVIAAARRAFRGALTYAASGPGEAKQLDFWPELDFVGIDLFRSLSSNQTVPTRPDDVQATARLRASLQQAFEFARGFGKSALITEIGFPPTSEAWRAPDGASGELDLEEQRRLFACAADALRRMTASGSLLSGVYVWGWSTDPNAGRVTDRSFTPQNRPAARSVAKMFGRQ